MTDLDAQIERVKSEATERWGDKWVIKINLFADGDSQCHAMKSHGLDDDENLVQDRLYVLENGETAVERVTMEQRELNNETIEAPASSV
jgi:hypothetical protein